MKTISFPPIPCCIALLLLMLGSSLMAQQQLSTRDSPDEPLRSIQFPNTPIPVILLEYEAITGKKIIRDANIQDKNLSILTSGKMTYPEAADFIERSLLLNGYALIPTENENQLKIIAFNQKNLSSEGLPVMTAPQQLPNSEQVVTYIMPLIYLESEAAAELFSNAIELHPFGKITPLENTSALIVTESASVIRRLLEIRDHLDVSPMKTINRSFQLERSDAEEIVDALIEILGLDQETSQTTTRNNQGNGNRQNNNQAASSAANGGAVTATPNSPAPRVHAIQRANKVFASATARDMDNIEEIISYLDAPAETARYIQRKLKYLEVSKFLEIASNVLLRGRENVDSSEITGGQNNSGVNANQNRLGGTGQSGVGQNGTIGNGQNGSRSTGDLGSAGADSAAAPQSIVVDKTLLVADNVQNMLIASGPPEELALVCELLDSMDVRPQQIQISAVIAQLNLGDDFDLGIDFLRSFEPPTNGTFNGGGSFVSRTGGSQNLLDIATLTDVSNLLPAAQGFTFYGQINEYLDTFISALDTTNRFEVLSRPTVYTVNNRQAVIESGQRIAVPRSTLSSLGNGGINNNNNQIVTANIEFEEVVLRIAVLPLINSEGEITLQIQQQNDSIIGSQLIGGDSIPTIATQTLGTTIITEDGSTILLGGLISESDQKAESGLPLFANFPFVGRVFGSTNDSVSRQELLIFLQPKIISDPNDQFAVDNDMLDRTEVGDEALDFSTNDDNNVDLFQTQDFNSPEKRIHFFRNLFKKKPSIRAVPIEE